MHSEHSYSLREPSLPLGDQSGYYMQNAPTVPVFNGFLPYAVDPTIPFHRVDIQPSDACPKNFIIFDQTNNRSQIMFHPEISSNLFFPGFGVDTPIVPTNPNQVHPSDEIKVSSSFKENSDDINALLGTDYEENGQCDDDDDDEVSTARTNAVYECNSPDSYSNYKSPSLKNRSLFRKSSGSRGNDMRRQKMKKMVKALRGIVPGANRMSNVAVLDEAVRYLKSLRVEVQKLGVGNSKV